MFKKLTAVAIALLVTLLPLSKVSAATTPVNMIANPSVESSATGATPDSWLSGNYGTNTSTLTYLSTGHTGTHSLRIDTTAYTDGAANWYYADVPVTAGQTYEYSNWYQSNVDSEVDAEVVVNGVTQYAYLGTVLANTAWTQFKTTYTAPAGATSMAIYQILAKVGYVVSDDYSLTAYTATPFTRPIVSVTFDDGWTNQVTNAAPIMKTNGFLGTYYIISNEVKAATPPDGAEYMTQAQMKALFAAGNEIGSHTLDHCELTTGLTEPAGPACPGFNLNAEMATSKSVLEGLVGAGKVTDFAYPYGSYNATTIAAGQTAGYASQRSVDRGYNTKDNFDATKLKIYEVDTTNTTAEVQGWINEAITEKAWLVLVYHEVADKAAAGDEGYNVKTVDFAAQMAYLKSTGVTVETVAQALAETKAQIGTVTPPATKPGDVNGDGVVNIKDATLISVNWNKTGATQAQGDLNGDGVVNIKDATLVSLNWGK